MDLQFNFSDWLFPNLKDHAETRSRELYPKKAMDTIRNQLSNPVIISAFTKNYEFLNDRERLERVKAQQTMFKKLHKNLELWEENHDYYVNTPVWKHATKERGRLFSEKSLSYASMARTLRHTLAYGIYDDLDIKNAHPVLLLQWLAKYDIQNKALEHYVNNREEVLKQVCEETGLTRGSAKQMLLAIMNQGTGISTLKAEKVNPERKGFAQEFYEAMQITLQRVYSICSSNSDLKKYVSRKRERKLGSTLNNILCDLENLVLFHIVSKLKSLGHQVDTLCFDGCMVRRGYDENSSCFDTEISVSESEMREIEEHVRSETGYRISLEIKPFSSTIDIKSISKDGQLKEIPNIFTMVQTYYNIEGKNNIIMCDDQIFYFDSNTTRLWTPIKKGQLGNIMSKSLESHYISTVGCLETLETLRGILCKAKTSRELSEIYTNELEYITDRSIISKLNRKAPYLIPFGTKVIDIRSLAVRDIEHSDYFTSTFYNSFDEELMNCDETESLVSDFFRYEDEDGNRRFDRETFESFKLAIGYSLTGYTNQKCAFFLLGQTDAGKSFFQRFLHTILGEQSELIKPVSQKLFIKSEGSSIESQYEAIERGARIGICAEFDDRQKIDPSSFKKITGSDSISFRPIRSAERTFTSIAKFFISTNEIPSFKTDDTAIIKRMVIYPFKNSFEDNHKFVEEFFKNYRKSAFSWCIKQAHEYYKKGKIPLTKAMSDTRTEIVMEKNPLVRFARNYIETDNESEFTPSWRLWIDFDYSYNGREAIMTEKKFYSNLKTVMPNKIKVDRIIDGRRTTSLYKYKLASDIEL